MIFSTELDHRGESYDILLQSTYPHYIKGNGQIHPAERRQIRGDGMPGHVLFFEYLFHSDQKVSNFQEITLYFDIVANMVSLGDDPADQENMLKLSNRIYTHLFRNDE
jgi:hypothetical protein